MSGQDTFSSHVMSLHRTVHVLCCKISKLIARQLAMRMRSGANYHEATADLVPADCQAPLSTMASPTTLPHQLCFPAPLVPTSTGGTVPCAWRSSSLALYQ